MCVGVSVLCMVKEFLQEGLGVGSPCGLLGFEYKTFILDC